jgi:hypothetical protein
MTNVLTRFGGGLLVVGSLIAVGLIAIAVAGGEVGLGGPSGTDLLASVSVAALGVGGAALSLHGLRTSGSRSANIGLGLAAIGLLGLAASASANTGSDTSPLLWVLLGSLALLVVGLPLTAVALLLGGAQSRLAGFLLAAGCAGLLLHIATGSVLSSALLAGIPLGFLVIGISTLRPTFGGAH